MQLVPKVLFSIWSITKYHHLLLNGLVSQWQQLQISSEQLRSPGLHIYPVSSIGCTKQWRMVAQFVVAAKLWCHSQHNFTSNWKLQIHAVETGLYMDYITMCILAFIPSGYMTLKQWMLIPPPSQQLRNTYGEEMCTYVPQISQAPMNMTCHHIIYEHPNMHTTCRSWI